jgi:hypothetical protein
MGLKKETTQQATNKTTTVIFMEVYMEMKGENIVNLIEQMIDLKVRQALLVKDLSNTSTYMQSRQDAEAIQQVKHQLVQFLDN